MAKIVSWMERGSRSSWPTPAGGGTWSLTLPGLTSDLLPPGFRHDLSEALPALSWLISCWGRSLALCCKIGCWRREPVAVTGTQQPAFAGHMGLRAEMDMHLPFTSIPGFALPCFTTALLLLSVCYETRRLFNMILSTAYSLNDQSKCNAFSFFIITN